jgi:group II intron reverse transcriptase/maturase
MYRTVGSEQIMRTYLQAISDKARRCASHRFLNLYTMLNKSFLIDCWPYMNKHAARGIDGISAGEYEKDLEANIDSLVSRLKDRKYRAKLVRRHYIPKGGEKFRPLGIPVIEDKLLQLAVSRILGSIYEVDFLDNSFGYRPKRGGLDAVKSLTYELQYGWFGYVVEADISGFFDHLDHGWLMEMLSYKISDDPFLGLIGKWLRAGILDTDGAVLHPVTGTPQGGVVSPVLANIYLHFVLDLWYEKIINPRCEGDVYLCRYADDFVCLFQYKTDAEKFYEALPRRLCKFGLSIAPEKTQIVRFTKHNLRSNTRFDFLGFEFRWGLSLLGKPQIKRRTSRKKFQQSLRNMKAWCKKARDWPLGEMMRTLNRKLRGYYNYYGVIGNLYELRAFYECVCKILFKWLNRRSQRCSYNRAQFADMLDHFKLAKPRIVQKRDYQLRAEQTSG